MKKATQPLVSGAPAPGEIGYAYDVQDNLASVIDPRGLATTYGYSGFNEVKTLVSPDTGTATYTYDVAGNVKTTQDARGESASYTYDALNRLMQLLHSDETIAYTYDDLTLSPNSTGRLSKLTDGSGSTTLAYDPRGRITTKTHVVGAVSLPVRYGYNAAGQLATLSTPANNAIEYGYAHNQIVSVKVNGVNILTGAKYFPFGGVASWTWGNGQGYQRVFDLDGRIQSVTIAGQTRHYGFDDASRITSLTDKQGATTQASATIAYDNLDRLTSANQTGANPHVQLFDYDLVGNRRSQSVSIVSSTTSGPTVTTYTYDANSNRLVKAGATDVGYDAVGNTISDGALNYKYSGRNRLVEVKQGASALATYKHNALGQRVAKTVSGTTTHFAYDEAGQLLGEYDASGAPIQETVWLNGTPIATLRKTGATVTIHYIWASPSFPDTLVRCFGLQTAAQTVLG